MNGNGDRRLWWFARGLFAAFVVGSALCGALGAASTMLLGTLLVVCSVSPSRRRALRLFVRARRSAVRLFVEPRCRRRLVGATGGAAVFVLAGTDVFAADPWQAAAKNICDAFYGPIGRGLSLVAVVIGGLMFAFGEGGSKSALAGLAFGAGMVLLAPQFLNWLGFGTIAC